MKATNALLIKDIALRISPSRRWILFTALLLLFGLSMFYRSSLAVLAPDLVRDLRLDMADLGLISASFFYAHALLQIPGALLLDRIGPAKIMPAFYFVALAGAVLFSVAESTGIMVLGRLLMGVGMACAFIGALKIFTLRFSTSNFGTLSSFLYSVGNAGVILATTPLVLCMQVVGWRNALLLTALFHFVVTLVFIFSIRDCSKGGKCKSAIVAVDQAGILKGICLILQNRQVWLLSAAAFIRYGIISAVQSIWAGPYLRVVMGVSPVMTGNILFLLTLGIIVGGPISGFLSDRVFGTRKWIMVVATSGLCLILAVLAVLPSGLPAWCLAVLFMIFGMLSSTGVLQFAQVKEHVPSDYSATAMTFINIFAVLGAGIVMQGMGVLIASSHSEAILRVEAFRNAFLLCAALMGVAMVLYAATKESYLRK
ncbi:MAG: MFS transporter [Deltaproteobacteria bacterium]|nr:MFS transporter [Deltaproteobacteria bacterium]